MKRIVLLLAAATLTFSGASAQNRHDGHGRHAHEGRRIERQSHKGQSHKNLDRAEIHEGHEGRGNHEAVKVLSHKSTMVGENIRLDFLINYDRVVPQPDEQMVITPYLTDGEHRLWMAPVIIAGERAFHKDGRKETLTSVPPSTLAPYKTVVVARDQARKMERALHDRNNAYDVQSPNTVDYSSTFAYDRWMDGARLMLHHDVANTKTDEYTYNTLVGHILNPMPPQVSFITPAVEVVKARSASMTARVVFPVNKTAIDTKLRDNAAELEAIYKFTDKNLAEKDIRITGLKLVGYASPEGNYKHNSDLSIGRVNALRDIIQKKYSGSLDKSLYQTSNVPEDWDSVRRWVAASHITHRTEVVDIIDNTAEPDARDAKIRGIDRSVTYNDLLGNLYPGLRRTEYTISYVVVPFTVERGKEVIKTNPSHLSLNEFYLIAESYPTDSKEYTETFATAAKYFPNDPVAHNNMAAVALHAGDLATARMHLAGLTDYPGAQNNLGVLNALEGNKEAAAEYFRKAINAGSPEARTNLDNIDSLKR